MFVRNGFDQLDLSSDWLDLPPGTSSISLTINSTDKPLIELRHRHASLRWKISFRIFVTIQRELARKATDYLECSDRRTRLEAFLLADSLDLSNVGSSTRHANGRSPSAPNKSGSVDFVDPHG